MTFEPMKAVLTDKPFSDPNWIYERKLDGIRCIASRRDGRVQLSSRTGHSQNAAYPELVEALEAEREQDFMIDGEIVAFRGDRTSFELLQQRTHLKVRVYLYVFDIVRHAGTDVMDLPLRERKALLRRSLEFHGAVRYTEHRNGDGVHYFAEACRKGWEGLIAKRADSPYVQKRSRDWLKFKCSAEQELVIGGFTAPHGSRTDFGALLVGYYEGSKLHYAGKVGTGFSEETLRSLGKRLRELERDTPAFVDVHPIPRGTHWVAPELVGQVGFTEWTRDGRLRHPRFLGLRDDKPAREVVRERPS
jgi:bifunctional non-homologous end joining protein LigD